MEHLAVMNHIVDTARHIDQPKINLTGGIQCVNPALYNAMDDEDQWSSSFHILRIAEHTCLWTNQFTYVKGFKLGSNAFYLSSR
jgi:hypothetical protein